jgi:hypothetical protein
MFKTKLDGVVFFGGENICKDVFLKISRFESFTIASIPKTSFNQQLI